MDDPHSFPDAAALTRPHTASAPPSPSSAAADAFAAATAANAALAAFGPMLGGSECEGSADSLHWRVKWIGIMVASWERAGVCAKKKKHVNSRTSHSLNPTISPHSCPKVRHPSLRHRSR